MSHEEYPLRRLDVTQDEVIEWIGLLANPADMDNQTAIRFSVAGLYTPTNEVVLSVLDRLDSSRANDFEDDTERAEGDFMSRKNLRDLNVLLKGVEDIERRVGITRMYMQSAHKKWAYRQRRLRPGQFSE